MDIYVLLTSSDETAAVTNNDASCTLASGLAPSVSFVDTDTDGIINVQDALDITPAIINHMHISPEKTTTPRSPETTTLCNTRQWSN